MNIIPATAKMIKDFYGGSVPFSMRGYFLVDDDGTPLGVSGFIRRSRNTMILFIDAKEGAYKNKKMIVKFANMMMNIADQNKWTLIAVADETQPTSEGFIKHFGFEQVDEGEYVRWPV